MTAEDENSTDSDARDEDAGRRDPAIGDPAIDDPAIGQAAAAQPVAEPGEARPVVDDAQAAAGEADPFDAPATRVEQDPDALIVDIDGYAGPLDLLLDLARRQKVDLRKISMLALVEQYLAFVEAAKARRLELAADYLVMAAWLTFLKSKLLLPAPETQADEPTADDMAAHLAFQLQRLEAMRNAADALVASPQLGVDFAARGRPEGFQTVRRAAWRADLYDLLEAYSRQRVAAIDRTYAPEPPRVFTIEEARLRLERILGSIPDWVELGVLARFGDVDAPDASVRASAFNAALEFAKDGKMDLRQTGHYAPIYVRRRETPRPDQSSPR